MRARPSARPSRSASPTARRRPWPPSPRSARPATTTTARTSAIRALAGRLLLAGALALGGCGDEPAPAPTEEDPWADATYEVVEKGARPRPVLKGRLADDPEALAHEILFGHTRISDHFVNVEAWGIDQGELLTWGPEAAAAAPYLRDHLLEADAEERDTAAHVLVGMGAVGLPFLREALRSKHAASRAAVFHALEYVEEHGAALATEACAALTDPALEVRIAAVRALTCMQAKTPEVARALRAVLLAPRAEDDPSDAVRANACYGLHELGFDDAATLDAFELRVRDTEDDHVRQTALEAFIARCKDDDRVMRLADEMVDDPVLRPQAVTRLVEGGRDDPELIAAYIDGLPPRMQDDQRIEVAERLVKTGPNGQAAAIDLAFVVLDWGGHEGRKVRAAKVLGATGDVGRYHEHVHQALRAHVDPANETPAVVAACKAALRALGFAGAQPAKKGDDDE